MAGLDSGWYCEMPDIFTQHRMPVNRSNIPRKISMPNNRNIAEQRTLNLKRGFLRDPLFHKDYTAFMDNLLSNGYAERVPTTDLARSDGKVWYIPHHGVCHPKKGKIRVVFDCAASFQGTSLNAQLLSGPDLTSTLIGVLTRFRKEPVVLMSDVEAMFHQVQVPEEDVDLLRFLWWPVETSLSVWRSTGWLSICLGQHLLQVALILLYEDAQKTTKTSLASKCLRPSCTVFM